MSSRNKTSEITTQSEFAKLQALLVESLAIQRQCNQYIIKKLDTLENRLGTMEEVFKILDDNDEWEFLGSNIGTIGIKLKKLDDLVSELRHTEIPGAYIILEDLYHKLGFKHPLLPNAGRARNE